VLGGHARIIAGYHRGVPDPIGWPPDEAVIQAIHDRYQREIVEDLNMCPFARRSRELGRVHRPVFVSTREHEPSPSEVARALAELVAARADAEIVLLTFPIPPGHRWNRAQEFERYLAELRVAWAAQPPPREFYMVSFHPRLEPPADRPLTADSLVSLIRRSPDPVIQCVDATLLDRVRRQAQASARERMLADLVARDPALAALFASSVAADPELSSDIARHNFDAHGASAGRERLLEAIAAILAARDRAYGLDR
jgi:hypothetical protein